MPFALSTLRYEERLFPFIHLLFDIFILLYSHSHHSNDSIFGTVLGLLVQQVQWLKMETNKRKQVKSIAF